MIKYNTDSGNNVVAINFQRKFTIDPIFVQIKLKYMLEQGSVQVRRIVSSTFREYELVTGAITKENEFKVDYDLNTLYFHESQKNVDVMVSANSYGTQSIGAENIYTNISSTDEILETLPEKLSSMDNRIESIEDKIGYGGMNGVSIDMFPKIIPEFSDDARINRAIEYAYNNNLANVYFKAEIYNIYHPIRPKENINLIGVQGGGMFSSYKNETLFMMCGDSNYNCIEIPYESRYCTITNICLSGKKEEGRTKGNGIYVTPSDLTNLECQLRLDNVTIRGFAENGLYIGNNRRAVRVFDCTFESNGANGILVEASDCTINDSIIGLNLENGIYVRNHVTKIKGCDIFHNKTGINIFGGNNCMINDTGIDRNKRHGIYIVAKNVTVTSCNIGSNSQEENGQFPNVQLENCSACMTNVSFRFDRSLANRPTNDVYLMGDSIVNAVNCQTDGYSNYTGMFNDLTKVRGSVQNCALPSIPTRGTWNVGDFVQNTSTIKLGNTGSMYTILGWKRLTNGSNNVLNTDWLECRALTGD